MHTHGTWGERKILFENDVIRVVKLTLMAGEKGQRCSWHYHKAQFNQFDVIAGHIGIKTDKGYVSILEDGDSFTVEPGIYHEFHVYEDSIVIETAWVQFSPYDIYRTKVGGPLSDEDKESVLNQVIQDVEI